MKTAYEHTKVLIQKVTPAAAYDGGAFPQWQNSARQTLSQLLGMDKFDKVSPELDIEYETKLPNATEIRFTFQARQATVSPAIC